ncbi:MAG: hypothetical protein QXU98_07650 [Candidatus Parvarchaeota archaeon]
MKPGWANGYREAILRTDSEYLGSNFYDVAAIGPYDHPERSRFNSIDHTGSSNILKIT